MKNLKNVIGLLIVLVSVFAVACGSDTIVPAGTVGETASGAIVAADGGTVALASGVAKVVIPAGALATDVTITLNTLDNAGAADEARLASFVFEFGPDGTTFTTPVAISLEAAAAPSGKKAVLAWLDGDKWTEIEGSKVVGGMVTGEVTHFSKYVVYLKDDKVIIDNLDPACKDITFSACGGSPAGTWTLESYCMETRVDQVDTNPWQQIPQCAETGNVSYIVDIQFTGEMMINADGTYVSTMDAVAQADIVIKDACLEAMTGGALSASAYCEQMFTSMADDNPELTHSYSGGACTISGPMGKSDDTNEPETGFWVADGNFLKTGSSVEDAQAATGVEYCISGSTMKVQNVDGDDTNDDGTDDVFYHDIMIWKK